MRKAHTVEYIEHRLRLNCVTAPINIPKLVQTFKEDEELMHKAISFYTNGLLNSYKMLLGSIKK